MRLLSSLWILIQQFWMFWGRKLWKISMDFIVMRKIKVKRLKIFLFKCISSLSCIFKVAMIVWKSRACFTFVVTLALFLSFFLSHFYFLFLLIHFLFISFFCFVLRSTHVLSVLHEKRMLLWTAERNFS